MYNFTGADYQTHLQVIKFQKSNRHTGNTGLSEPLLALRESSHVQLVHGVHAVHYTLI